jgi:hypothetical protein
VRFSWLTLAGVGSHWGAITFAQAAPTVDPAAGWISVVIQSGSFGLIAYLFVVGWPKFQREIKEERKGERDAFTNSLREERAESAKMVESIRDAARKEVESLRAVFAQEQREMREYYAKEAAAMRQVYADSAAAMRTAVHQMSQAAQNTMNKAAVAIEVAKQQGQA